MNDIYSLHTEKDIEHRKELQIKQAEIQRLIESNDQLLEENKLIRHNMALLLVSQRINVYSDAAPGLSKELEN